jgi:hypothetical protein
LTKPDDRLKAGGKPRRAARLNQAPISSRNSYNKTITLQEALT